VGPRIGGLLSLTTGSNAAATGFPTSNGYVNAAVPDGSAARSIGGQFNAVGGVTAQQLAHIRGDGTLDPDWNPSANNAVYALCSQAARSSSAATSPARMRSVGRPVAPGEGSATAPGGDPSFLPPNFNLGVRRSRSSVEALRRRAVSLAATAPGTRGASCGSRRRRLRSFTDTWSPSVDGPVYALAVSGTSCSRRQFTAVHAMAGPGARSRHDGTRPAPRT